MVGPAEFGNLDRLLNNLSSGRASLNNSIDKIASGRRLNRAGEDPAANALSRQLQSEIRTLSQAVNNVESGSNLLRTAGGGLSAVGDLVARGRELAAQASNGTLNDTQRQALNQEFNQVRAEIDRVSQSLEFNGQRLLDGSLGSGSSTRVDIQAGTGSGPENRINVNVIEDSSSQALGIAESDISTAEGALQATEDLGRAADTINAARGEIGAVSNRLVSSANNLGSSIENLTQSESSLADTDLAAELTGLQQGLLRFETSIRALALQNDLGGRQAGRLLDTIG